MKYTLLPLFLFFSTQASAQSLPAGTHRFSFSCANKDYAVSGDIVQIEGQKKWEVINISFEVIGEGPATKGLKGNSVRTPEGRRIDFVNRRATSFVSVHIHDKFDNSYRSAKGVISAMWYTLSGKNPNLSCAAMTTNTYSTTPTF